MTADSHGLPTFSWQSLFNLLDGIPLEACDVETKSDLPGIPADWVRRAAERLLLCFVGLTTCATLCGVLWYTLNFIGYIFYLLFSAFGRGTQQSRGKARYHEF